MVWTTDETEISLLNDLINKSVLLVNKEKPIMNGTLFDPINRAEYTCDLIWKKAKVIFLTAENNDILSVIQEGGWTYFYGATKDLTANEIIRAIQEA